MSDSIVNREESRQAEFVGLLTAHQPDIYLYLRSLVLDPDEASEILQEANLVLWEKRGEFRPDSNFRAWAFQIARYKMLQHQQRRRRACRCFSDALVDELMLQAAESDRRLDDLIDELRRCVAMLSARDRELIAMRYAPRATCRGVAQRIGRPVRWVYKAVARIRKTLIECVSRESAVGRKQ